MLDGLAMTSSVVRPVPSDPPPRIRLRSPADVVAAVPVLLGFHPEHSLVVIGLKTGRVVLTVRVDLPGIGGPGGGSGQLDDALERVVRGLRHAAASMLLVVMFTADSELAERTRQAVLARLQGNGGDASGWTADIVDVLRVHDDRFWSLICEDSTCCGPDGTQVERESNRVLAEGVLAGVEILPSREALAGRVGPEVGARRAAALQAAADAHEQIAELVTQEGVAAAQRRGLAMLGRLTQAAASDLAAGPSRTEAAELAVLLQIGEIRDAVYRLIAEEASGPAVEQVLHGCLRLLPVEEASPVAALLALACYCRGDGASANAALESVPRLDEDHPCVRLVQDLLAAAVPPPVLRSTLRRATAA